MELLIVLALIVLSFVLFPKLMFGVLLSLLRAIPALVVDGVALLFAWV